MFVWTRHGYVAPFVLAAGYVGVIEVCHLEYGPYYIRYHSWPGAAGVLLGAALLLVIADRISVKPRMLLDPRRERTVTVRERDTFLLLPLHAVALLMMPLAVALFLLRTNSPLPQWWPL